MAIQPYLFFNGRCEEAVAFYQKALGAQLSMLMRFDECPDSPPQGLPPGWGKKVMHASLNIGDANVMMSDVDSCLSPNRASWDPLVTATK